MTISVMLTAQLLKFNVFFVVILKTLLKFCFSFLFFSFFCWASAFLLFPLVNKLIELKQS